MEKIKAYHNIQPFLSKYQKKQVAEMLNLTEEDLTTRLQGKEKEYEFLFRAYCLGEIDKIIAFEEGLSRLTDTVSTDFLFIMKNNKRIAVEVKSTKKKKWFISKKQLKEKQEFAQLMGAELYFAIKIEKYWMFFSDDYVVSKNYKITREKDYFNSQFDILGEKSFLFVDSIKIKSTYSKNKDKTLIIEDALYGNLKSYVIEFKGKEILKITNDTKEGIKYSVLLEAIQDSASIHSQKVEILGPNETLVIEELNKCSLFLLSHLMIAPILHARNGLNKPYDNISAYITEMVDARKKYSIPVPEVIAVLDYLKTCGVRIEEVVGNKVVGSNEVITIS
ncbi:hypothetical protein [Bacillus cereus]|uniref:hypothetical protein n=1 Tax=Bacillus cereus TaxID=1396 RepID=UPI001595848B|nr:hypothetical protein [Bacillus cereus]